MILLQEAQTYAQANGLFFMETSAKTATNVNDIFYEIGKDYSLKLKSYLRSYHPVMVRYLDSSPEYL